MLDNLNHYADYMRNWCVSTDPICAAHLPDPDEDSHLDYYDLDSEAAASWIKSVASLTDDSDHTTKIPISLSGTVQNYATIGSATPSGSVTLDTTWTSSSSYAACTSTSYVQSASNGTMSAANSTMSSTRGSTTKGAITKGATTTGSTTAKTSLAGGSGASASATAASSGAGAAHTVGGGLFGLVLIFLTVLVM